MLLSVKALGSFTILLFFLNVSNAQFRFASRGNQDVAAGVQQVISDYPNQFRNIIGDLIIQNPQSADYRCTIQLGENKESFITKYSSTDKAIYSWQTFLLSTENFNEARRKFKSLYNELSNLPVGGSYLKGVYEDPAESKIFTSVLFSISPMAESTKKLRVELVMEAEMMEWKVRLLVYDRDREDNESGKVVE